VQRRTAPKTMAWWLFYFVSRGSFTVLWVVLFLQARNGCPSVFLSFSALSLCLCVRKESFWVGWTQAFSGSLLWFCPCFCSGFPLSFWVFSSLFLLAFLSSCFCFLPRFCSFFCLWFSGPIPLCSASQFPPVLPLSFLPVLPPSVRPLLFFVSGRSLSLFSCWVPPSFQSHSLLVSVQFPLSCAWTISGFYSQRTKPFLQAINCVNCRCNGDDIRFSGLVNGRR